MGHSAEPHLDLSAVPLFALPNVVLFPRAVLPLHVFEERYKTMTAHVLAGDRLIAMALLGPGWEKSYYHRPPIDPVVCVGEILSFEKLPDGKYNFLLQGRARARVAAEVGDGPYRVARLEPLRETPVLEIDFEQDRRKLQNAFEEGAWAGTGIGRQFRRLLDSPLPTSDVADLIAFNFLEDTNLKQSLLAETDVRSRISRILEAFESLRPEPALAPFSSCRDPSLN